MPDPTPAPPFSPPCDAYHAIVDAIDGHNHPYFRTPPPPKGLRLRAVGRDHQVSEWYFDDALAVTIAFKLAGDRRLIGHHLTRYDDR